MSSSKQNFLEGTPYIGDQFYGTWKYNGQHQIGGNCEDFFQYWHVKVIFLNMCANTEVCDTLKFNSGKSLTLQI